MVKFFDSFKYYSDVNKLGLNASGNESGLSENPGSRWLDVLKENISIVSWIYLHILMLDVRYFLGLCILGYCFQCFFIELTDSFSINIWFHIAQPVNYQLLACAINFSLTAEIGSDAWMKYINEFKFGSDIENRS